MVTNVWLLVCMFTFFKESVGSSGPKVSVKEKFNHLSVTLGQLFAVSCPAQGHPVPAFRYIKPRLVVIEVPL